jgi:hypothetical protein
MWSESDFDFAMPSSRRPKSIAPSLYMRCEQNVGEQLCCLESGSLRGEFAQASSSASGEDSTKPAFREGEMSTPCRPQSCTSK